MKAPWMISELSSDPIVEMQGYNAREMAFRASLGSEIKTCAEELA
jgi:hypothetical protein